ncbi:Tc toxin subunit A [Moorena sp. SIO4G3]|uniref:Tc toxin subunit A n=1 Tax=Moorena sp. SIO4G3 TaxID=2607821 RepID=UPI00142C6673|nr:Tc toxin subunit A [Moorena sp. SIO4G3]NEO78964.1 hypothetical protein [Moorena sp. SIO4G3]
MSTIKISDNNLNSFYNQNPDFDILQFNFRNGQADKLNWDNLERETILELLKKYQRLLRLNPDPEIAKALLNQSTQPREGEVLSSEELDSAHAIAAIPETEFIQDYSEILSVNGEQDGEQVALTIHQNATAVKAQTALLWANVHHQVASPHTRAMGVNNVGSDIHKFEDFPSYQELFGTLNYCECEHCRSIFSPAAYFVDLMRIVDRYITQPNKDKIPANFQLENRRPDLAEIELTCEKTNHQIPYLQIVNERLTYLVNTLLQRDPDTVPFRALAEQNYPFNLPFNLPLTQIRTYLAQLKTSLFDIYSVFGVDEKEVAREYLELSHQEYQLITTSSAQDSQALGKSYGVDNLTNTEIDKLKNVDNFLARTGLTLDELNQLLYQNLSKPEIEAGMCHQFFINRGLGNNDYLQISPDSNEITHLNSDTLDRINRFVRLAKKLNWSFADLDWVLRAISNDNPKIDDDSNTIIKIAKIKQIAEKYKLKLDVVCSFWHDIKTSGVGDNEPSQALFDIVFNHHYLLGGQEPYHPDYKDLSGNYLNPLYQETPLTWKVGQNNETATNASRVAAGLRISLDELKALRIAFFSNSNSEEEIDLTVQNLSVFYRHAQLATIAKLPIEQYLILLRLINKQIQIFAVEDVVEILDMVVWLRKSGFHVYELDYILNGTESKYVGKWDKEEDIQRFLESLQTIKIDRHKADELLEELKTIVDNSTSSSDTQYLLSTLWENVMGFIGRTIVLPDSVEKEIKDSFKEIEKQNPQGEDTDPIYLR